MKAKVASAIGALLVTATWTHAQAPQQGTRPYGSIAMIAIRDQLDARGIAVETARIVWSELRREEKIAVRGEVLTVEVITADALIKAAAASSTENVAVISYADQVEDRTQGTIALDIYSIDAPAVVPRLTYAEATLPNPVTPLIVRTLAGKITEVISDGAEIYVVLTLRTRPVRSTFTVGQSSPRQTDGRGHATWAGTLPRGPQILRVFNDPAYAEQQKSINVVPEEPYFKRSVAVTLRRR